MLNLEAAEFKYSGGNSVKGSVAVPMRRKPQEFDGKVSWEAYRAQFKLLADKNGWNDYEHAVQLATSLKVLVQLDNAKKCSYRNLSQVLELHYSSRHQREVQHARFQTRIRRRGESLRELAHNLDNMAHHAYPGAPL